MSYKTWQECHRLNGILHRAFSIFIFNDKGELLLQKRSKYKKLWPLFWSNSCCSHPVSPRHPEPDPPTGGEGEGSLDETIKLAEKRLKEEFGFTTKLKFLFKFQYKAVCKNIGSENEVCRVLVGKYNGKVKANKKEVADYKWVNIGWLKRDLKKNPDLYTPWFKEIIKNKNFAEYTRIICGE